MADFERAVQLLFDCRGRVIVTGMGKSGLICRKIAATLSSTGTSAWFLHPAEATHGDLGAIRDDDVVLALSYSGETEELIRLLESIRRIGAKLIALTGNPESTLARAADVTLDCGIAKEACPMNLVPTASTTAALAMGDALAMTLSSARDSGKSTSPRSIRAASSGRRLMRVEHVMHAGEAAPIVRVVDTDGRRVPRDVQQTPRHDVRCRRREPAGGRFTDGDLRRADEPLAERARDDGGEAMTPRPVTISRELLAVEALKIMETYKITSVVVVDRRRAVEGVVHLHDLWRDADVVALVVRGPKFAVRDFVCGW